MGDSGCRKCGEDGHFARFVAHLVLKDQAVMFDWMVVGLLKKLHWIE